MPQQGRCAAPLRTLAIVVCVLLLAGCRLSADKSARLQAVANDYHRLDLSHRTVVEREFVLPASEKKATLAPTGAPAAAEALATEPSPAKLRSVRRTLVLQYPHPAGKSGLAFAGVVWEAADGTTSKRQAFTKLPGWRDRLSWWKRTPAHIVWGTELDKSELDEIVQSLADTDLLTGPAGTQPSYTQVRLNARRWHQSGRNAPLLEALADRVENEGEMLELHSMDVPLLARRDKPDVLSVAQKSTDSKPLAPLTGSAGSAIPTKVALFPSPTAGAQPAAAQRQSWPGTLTATPTITDWSVLPASSEQSEAVR